MKTATINLPDDFNSAKILRALNMIIKDQTYKEDTGELLSAMSIISSVAEQIGQPGKTDAPVDEFEMPYGKYKGCLLATIPSSYIMWAKNNIEDERIFEAMVNEWERREDNNSHFWE